MSAQGELDLVTEWLDDDGKRWLRHVAEQYIVARRSGARLTLHVETARVEREAEAHTRKYSL